MIEKRTKPLSAAFYGIVLFLIIALTTGPVLAQAGIPPVFRLGWGSLGTGDQEFVSNHGVAVQELDDGLGNLYTEVYVADTNNSRIKIFDDSGTYLRSLGVGGELFLPNGVDVDANGNVFVADTYDNQIVRYSAEDSTFTEWGSRGSSENPVQFWLPTDVAVYGSGASLVLYVADSYNDRVLKLDYEGNTVTSFAGTPDKDFFSPTGVDVDANGNAYVTDSYNHRVVKISADGTSVTLFAGTTVGSGNGQFNTPNGIAVDSVGNVYVSDTNNDRIQKFDSDGLYLTQWNTGSSALRNPYAVAALGENEVYVADTGNHRIQAYEMNVAPTAIVIDNASILENLPAGTLVGTFTTTDSNTGEAQSFFTYQFVDTLTGEDCTGNSSFQIDGRTLESKVVFDYDEQTSYPICVRVTDSGGLSYETSFQIDIIQGQVPPIFEDDSFTINEYTTDTTDDSRAQPDDLVGTLTATDPNAVDTITFSIEPGPYADAFKIGATTSTTAELLVNDATLLNYESTAPDFFVSVTVRAKDSSVDQLSDTAVITVNLNDLNDPPVFAFYPPAPDNYFSIDEGIYPATLDGYFTITDEDLPGDTITVNENSNYYAINTPSSPGVYTLRVSSPRNYDEITKSDEIGRYETFDLYAKDGDGSIIYSTTPYRGLKVYVNNKNEPPSPVSGCFVNETLTLGEEIPGCALDPENDPIFYEKVLDESGGAFDVIGEKFIVSDPSRIDYETMGTIKYYYFTFRVHDAANPDIIKQGKVKITVADINEFKPELNVVPFSIPENVANGYHVGYVGTNDGVDLDKFSYTFSTPDGETGPYRVYSNGLIVVRDTRMLNFEVASTYNLIVKAYEVGSTQPGDELEDIETFTITLTDTNDPIRIVDDTPASTTDRDQAFTVDEEVPGGTVVGTVLKTDEDADTQPTFSIFGGDGINMFDIEASTGTITVEPNVRLDYETKSTYTLNVSVTDNGLPTPSTDTTGVILITLNNVNDPPDLGDIEFTAPVPPLPEDAANGTEVGTVTATDRNGEAVTYSIVGGTGAAALSIDGTSGVITVSDTTKLDYETAENHALTVIVQAADSITPPATSTRTYSIPLGDVNEIPVVVNDPPFLVVQDSPNDTVVGTIDAYDPEDGKAGIIFQVSGSEGLSAFNVNTSTGVITVNNRTMMVSGRTFTINVVAQNTTPDPDEFSVSTPITINVTPKADPAMGTLVEPVKVLSGTTIPYLVTVNNLGQGPSDQVDVRLTLPSGLSFVSGTGCQDMGTGVVKCTKDTIPGLQNHVFEIMLQVNSGLGDGILLTIVSYLTTNDDNNLRSDNDRKTPDDSFRVYKEHHIDFDFTSAPIPGDWSAVNGSGTPMTVPWDSTPTGSNGFLGRLVSSTVTYQKDNLPYHTDVEVTFDLYVIRTWDGNGPNGPDIFKFKRNMGEGEEQTLLDTTFSNWAGFTEYPQCYPDNCPDHSNPVNNAAMSGIFTKNSLGYTYTVNDETRPMDSTYRITYKFSHSNLTLILKFIGEHLQTLADESWGIDNVHIVLTGSHENKVFIPLVRK